VVPENSRTLIALHLRRWVIASSAMGFWLKMMANFVVSLFKVRKDLALENLALRQQLAVLNRNAKRPQFTDADRLFWVFYSKISDGWQQVLVIAWPRTILDWQKNRFKKFWTRKSRKKVPGRPRTAPEIQKLIGTMSRANPLWGTPRIVGLVRSRLEVKILLKRVISL
jgi:hypothetical protein